MKKQEQFRNDLSSKISLSTIPSNLYHPESAYERSVLTRFEKLPSEIFTTSEEGAVHVAQEIANLVAEKQRQGEFCVVALSGGSTQKNVYQQLVKLYDDKKISFRNLVVFNLCEYYPLTAESLDTNYHMLKEMFFDHVDIDDRNIYSLHGTYSKDDVFEVCRLYEEQIEHFGGIDIALLGIGKSGNVAFNGPGSRPNSRTRLVLLDGDMRTDAVRLFGSFAKHHTSSLTIGLASIIKAKEIFLTAWGDEKADIIKRCVEGEADDDCPASLLQEADNVHVILDLQSSSKLTRLEHPWLVTSCQWNDKMIRSAIVWLCDRTKKPILKLTDKDYRTHGLEELLALYGSAYQVNIKIFNDLQHTITGWPGGKPNADDTYRPERATPFPKRVVIFSPHPDDDVISMGGTLRRLVQQGHDVHVVYETSGNIAVGDEEVVRFLHFINGFNQMFLDNSAGDITKIYKEIRGFLKSKTANDLDSKDVLRIKGLIRRGEARTACTYNEVPLDHVHFLDLPFYETGKITKNPISSEDVHIVRELLSEIKPHQIFVAGDLADPHGTHKVCTDAVLASIDLEKAAKAKWLDDCRIWMYRGAWAEWEIENIEMAVPISPEELRAKRNAILKHQSQMESAPFLGNDERLFWQRSEDRNRASAEIYRNLGLASYEAIEAFVEYHPL